MDIDQFIKEAQARCEKASPKPWVRHVYQSGSVSVATSDRQWFDVCHVKQMVPDSKMNWADDDSVDAEVQRLANAEFIANARQDLPAALEIIAALRARVAELEAALEAQLEAQQALVEAATKLSKHLEFTYGPISPSLSPTKILVCELSAELEKVKK